MGLFGASPLGPAAPAGGRPGKPCGDGHIAAPLTCHKGAEGSPKPQGPGIGDTFSADEAVALTVLADKKLRSDKARRLAMIDRGVKPDTDFVGLISQAREKLGGPDWWQDESGWKDKLQRFAAAAAGVGTTKAQPLPRQQSRPPAAAKTKPQGKELMTSAEVKSSADQLVFAKQQQAAARSAGDKKGEKAWAELQRDVQRRRLGAALAVKGQSQQGLFGGTDYDESLPLFGRKDAANWVRSEIASIVRAEIESQFRQPVQLLSLNSTRATGAVSGRFRSGQMVFDYLVKGQTVSYGPIGAGAAQGRQDSTTEQANWAAASRAYIAGISGWSAARVDGFLDAAARLDAPRAGQRNCRTGYGCGSTCISLRKECRVSPRSAIGKQRLKRLLALAGGGDAGQRGIAPVRGKEAGALAEGIATRRGQEAARLRSPRPLAVPVGMQNYKLTASDLKKIRINTEEEYISSLAGFDVNKERMGRRFGLAKRNHASRLLRSTKSYFLGKGQGALDLAMAKPYMGLGTKTETFQNAWNLGYYTGYTNRSNLKDLIEHNENFSAIRAAMKAEGR